MANHSTDSQDASVARWSVAAIFAGGLAVSSVALSFVIPPNLLAGLQVSRGPVVNSNQLQSQIAQLMAAHAEIARENDVLRLQISQMERDGSFMVERVGALETAIPMLLEAVPPTAEIDRSLLTAAINPDPGAEFETDGGSVVVTTSPLFSAPPGQDLLEQDMPVALETSPVTIAPIVQDMPQPQNSESIQQFDRSSEPVLLNEPTYYGVALGDALGPMGEPLDDEAIIRWEDLSGKIGLLLIGTVPQIADPLQNGMARLVAGPLPDLSAAQDMCSRVVQVGIECLPVEYRADATPLLASR